MATLTIETPHGPARAQVTHPGGGGGAPRAAVVLGHGAGGGVSAPDLVAARHIALSLDLAVALVEQPYRVAGRRSAAPARQLDVAWTAVIDALRERELHGASIVAGGRSSGARVACRTAAVTGAVGVLCLAFPLVPPARAGATAPAASRLGELEAVSVPVLVVQGTNDRFGMPPAGPSRTVVAVRGDHGLQSDLDAVRAAIEPWLMVLLGGGAAR